MIRRTQVIKLALDFYGADFHCLPFQPYFNININDEQDFPSLTQSYLLRFGSAKADL